MKRLLREPLVHFLAIGLGLFVLFDLVAPEDAGLDEKTIVVDRPALLTFIQFRSKAFNPDAAAARLDALSDAELERLVDDYVREEALHREALALGMDQNDYVIKQRLIQSLQFITNGFVSAAVDISDEDIAEFEICLENFNCCGVDCFQGVVNLGMVIELNSHRNWL